MGEMPAARATSSSVGTRGGDCWRSYRVSITGSLLRLRAHSHVVGLSLMAYRFSSRLYLWQPAELFRFLGLASGLATQYFCYILLLFVVIAQSLMMAINERFYRGNDCYVICIACFFFIYRYRLFCL
nr:hypothetical protein PJ912_19085 [Pectobacterium colocasium]